MAKYATATTVSVANSTAEIERILQRYGADSFMHGWDRTRAVIGFRMDNRQIHIILPLPDRDSDEFRWTETGRERTASSAETAYEQACRQRWRALTLIIKAKLEAVECEISTIEREFLADTVMPNGLTIGEWIAPQIEEMYLTKKMPELLPMLSDKPTLAITAKG